MPDDVRFNEKLVPLVHELIVKSPPGCLSDVVTSVKQLVGNLGPKVPDDLVYRSCTDNLERTPTPVQVPTGGTGVICERARRGGAGSQRRICEYLLTDGGDDGDYCFEFDHGSGEVRPAKKLPDEREAGNLRSELHLGDTTAGMPYKLALDRALGPYVLERCPKSSNGPSVEQGTTAGVSTSLSAGTKVKEGRYDVRVEIASRKFRDAGFWAGCWNSTWKVEFAPGEDEPTTLAGSIYFKSHYREECNVHFDRKISRKLNTSPANDAERWATDVIAAIKSAEDQFQGQSDEMLSSSFGQLKAMRRVLPLSGERFDWRPLRRTLVRDMRDSQTSLLPRTDLS